MTMDPFKRGGSSALRKFTWRTALMLAVFTTVSFIFIYAWTVTLVRDGLRSEAESYVDLIVTTRSWNAAHGGTWVLKSDQSPTNEYLLDVGVEPDTSTVSGTQLTLRNPAAMTREISDLTLQGSGISFRIISQDPVNPSNAPDAWEAEQFTRLNNGEESVSEIEPIAGERFFRLMEPLVTRPECLTCHSAQGYEVGDLRGAISVTVPLTRTDEALKRSAIGLAALWAIVLAVLGLVLFALVDRLSRGLDRGEAKLRHMAVTDALTGLPNRHAILQRLHEEAARARRRNSTVGVLVVDLDRFKTVNDQWGHSAGDTVLKEAAIRMRDALREYDMVGRIGGEEFLVVAPELNAADLQALAERVRHSVSADPITIDDDVAITMTASVGGAIFPLAEEDADAAIARADDALYRAKNEGRDTVVIAGPED